MSDCVVLFRNTASGRVGFIADYDGEIAVFPTEDAATEAAEQTPIWRAFPCQIVSLDDL